MHDSRPCVAVTGIGEAAPVLADPRSIPEMVLAAVETALQDAGIWYDDIDAVVTASVDLFDGLTASNIAVTEVVGAVMKPESRVAADGLAALIHGACQLWSGAYRTVLVAAHAKPSMAPYQALTLWAMDPITLQPLGIDFRTCSGLEASVLQDEDPEAPRRWAERAAHRRRLAADHGGLLPACSVEDVLASPVIASPLREGMGAPLADGACAVVLQVAKDGPSGIRVSGVGHDLAAHGLGDRSLARWESATRACDRAYAFAGITDPQNAFDLVEPSCAFAHEEELFLRAARIDASRTMSPEGGLFTGAVPVVSGLSRLTTAVRRMRADAACRLAIAHGTWGPAGQAHAVAILEAA